MFHSIQADEATDISCNEQMCVAFRWVSKYYEIFEEPIGLVLMPKTDSATIFAAFKDVLLRCILPVMQGTCIRWCISDVRPSAWGSHSFQRLLLFMCIVCHIV